MGLLRSLSFGAALALLPYTALAQDDEQSAPPLEIWVCQAEWAQGDTMRYEVRLDERSFRNGVVTKQGHSDYGVRVVVLDSSATGYVLRWQRVIFDASTIASIREADEDLKRLNEALSTLDIVVRTNAYGSLLDVDDVQGTLAAYQANIKEFQEKYVQQLDSALRVQFERTVTLIDQNQELVEQLFISDVDLFFTPFGLEVLSDSFYTARTELPNVFTGGEIPGLLRVELMDVNEVNYQVDLTFEADQDQLAKEIGKTVATMRKRNGNKGAKVNKRELKDMELSLVRSEQYTIATEDGWPKRIRSHVVSNVKGESDFRREQTRSISTAVFLDQPKNELYYEQRIQEDPNDPMNYAQRGYYRRMKGNMVGAEEDQTMALTLDPDLASSYFERSITRLRTQRYALALEDAQAAMALDSTSADLHSLTSEILIELTRYEEALGSAQQALALDPEHIPAMTMASRALTELYRFQEANAYMDRALAVDSTNIDLLGSRAIGYSNLRTPEGDSLAIRDLEHARQLDPADYSTLMALAAFHLKKDEYPLAIAYYDTVITTIREDDIAILNRGFAKIEIGDLSGGIADLEMAIDLDPTNAFTYNNLGWAVHLNGDDTRALELIDHSIALRPDNSYAHYNKGRVLLAMDRTEAACTSLQDAEDLGFFVGFGPMVRDLQKEHCTP